MLGLFAADLVEEVYDEVLDRILDLTANLAVGPAVDNCAVGPVISAAQHTSISARSRAARRGRPGRRRVGVDMDGGYYIEPTIFADVSPNSRLGQHEIFGPVLSVIKAADFEDALAIANGTEFGLTGGLHSTSEENIATRYPRFPCRQPLLEPQDHRCACGDPAVWRFQHVWFECQGRRSRLPAAVHGDEVRGAAPLTAGHVAE